MSINDEKYKAHCGNCNTDFEYSESDIITECGYKGVRCPKCGYWIYHKVSEYIAIPMSEYEELKRYKEMHEKKENNPHNKMHSDFCEIEDSLYDLMMKKYGRIML